MCNLFSLIGIDLNCKGLIMESEKHLRINLIRLGKLLINNRRKRRKGNKCNRVVLQKMS